jgi:hypothetical protein
LRVQHVDNISATYPLSQALFDFIFLRDMPFDVRTHFLRNSPPIVDKKSDFSAKIYTHRPTGKHCLKTPVELSDRSRFSLVERSYDVTRDLRRLVGSHGNEIKPGAKEA